MQLISILQINDESKEIQDVSEEEAENEPIFEVKVETVKNEENEENEKIEDNLNEDISVPEPKKATKKSSTKMNISFNQSFEGKKSEEKQV